MKVSQAPYYKYLTHKMRTSALALSIVLLVLGIPLMLYLENTKTAKIFGISVVLLCVIGVYVLRTRKLRKFQSKVLSRLDKNDIFWLDKNISFYNSLASSDKAIFRSRIRLFLGEVLVSEVDKPEADRSTELYVASAAIIAFWGLPYWNYGDLAEVLVYPQNFDMNNQLNQKGLVLGKVHHGGLHDSTMILSLPALKHGFMNNQDKKNVGIHEFSHLLDKSDGEINGLPFFLNPQESTLWQQCVEKEISKIKTKHSDIKSYAATNKAEFFAVIMEYFRESPEILEKKHPEIYKILHSHLPEPQAIPEI